MSMEGRRRVVETIRQRTAAMREAGWCPSCGVSLYASERFEQTLAENGELMRRNSELERLLAEEKAKRSDDTAEILAEEIAGLRARLATENLYWLRNKVGRQAAQIRALEAKLRRKGVQPWAE